MKDWLYPFLLICCLSVIVISQTGCFLTSTGLRECIEVDTEWWEGCFERVREDDTIAPGEDMEAYLEDPPVFIQIEQSEDCSSQITGVGWGGITPAYAFEGTIVEEGRAEIEAVVYGYPVPSSIWEIELQRTEDDLLMITYVSVHYFYDPGTEYPGRTYQLEPLSSCPEDLDVRGY